MSSELLVTTRPHLLHADSFITLVAVANRWINNSVIIRLQSWQRTRCDGNSLTALKFLIFTAGIGLQTILAQLN